jgi:hypothetical protein
VHKHAGDLGFATMDSINLPSSPGKPFKRTRSLAQQASFPHAKNDPIKKPTKQQKTNEKVEWLITQLQNARGMSNFVICSTK